MHHAPPVTPQRRNRWLPLLGALLTLAFAGCAKVDDHLLIKADGSWSVTIEASSPLSQTQRAQMSSMLNMHQGDHGFALYPPFNQQEAAALFPGEGVHIQSDSLDRDEGVAQRSVISGDDLSTLLSSPYAQLRQLRLDRLDDGIQVSYVDPMRYLLPLIGDDTETDSEQTSNATAWLSMQLAPLKNHRHHWQSVQRLTLPGLEASDSAGTIDNQVVTWSHAGDEDQGLTQASNELLALRYAKGAALEVAIPEHPVRLGLRPFSNVAVGSTGGSAQEVDSEELQAAARWLPVSLQVKRSFNYTGERHHQRDDARLDFMLILPQRFEPTSWGSITLEDALTEDQASLMPRHKYSHGSSHNWRQQSNDGPLADKAWQRYQVRFNSPPRSAQTVHLVQVSTVLSFPGVPHVVKAATIISAEDIHEEEGNHWLHDDSQSLSFPDLDELGMAIRSLTVHNQGAAMQLSISLGDHHSRLQNLQIYDAQGRPWPVIKNPFMSSSNSSNYLILGQPEPPLSLALVVDNGGIEESLSHTFTDLPILPPADETNDQDDEE